MFPWFWLWAPQLRLPFSGDVAQDIEPRLDWFFNGIKPQAGNARIEAQAFEVASYGHQLGLITEALIDLAERQQAESEPLRELRAIRDRIEAIKAGEHERELAALEARVRQLRARRAAVD
ncbi:hypothetical protein [Roseateles saccharophilus]|uniref:Uncharacterized protein n=1 Tax=Roseateles saccharophilus TaxID=304 RepID=A0A4R3VAB5_ROSSA|nr:hypothetical protein [Roseateles saccharophilus]TCV00961.1 hypothetical protein EV671_100790 [Roseateles saccharophilus]